MVKSNRIRLVNKALQAGELFVGVDFGREEAMIIDTWRLTPDGDLVHVTTHQCPVAKLAGEGPLSDGVPRVYERDLDERDMPPPPKGSRYCGRDIGEDDTQKYRRPR